jgi:hypothetical protein
MPTPTYTALASRTLTSTATSVTFSSIPATYRDLILVIEGTYSTGTGNASIRFNGDTGSNYPYVFMLGGASGTSSGQATTTSLLTGGFNSATRNNVVFQIMDYSATDKHKSVLNRMNEGGLTTYAWGGRWANTSAITSITVIGTNPYAIGSTFSLYGVIA